MRGAITLLSCLVPALLLGLVVLLFAPGQSGRPALGPGAPSKAMRPEAWADIIARAEKDLTDDSPVVSVNLKITARGPGSVETLAAEGEALLGRFPSYVAGSFQVDVANRTGSLQYRGKDQHKNAYAFFVGLSTNTFVRAE